MRKQILEQSGVTPKGDRVIRHVHTICSTHGLSLTDVLQRFKEKDLVVDWEDYYLAAIKHGTKKYSIITSIKHAVVDVYGKEYYRNFLKPFQRLINADT